MRLPDAVSKFLAVFEEMRGVGFRRIFRFSRPGLQCIGVQTTGCHFEFGLSSACGLVRNVPKLSWVVGCKIGPHLGCVNVSSVKTKRFAKKVMG